MEICVFAIGKTVINKMKLFIAAAALVGTSASAQLIDEKDVSITLDLQPVLQLEMTTPDQIQFIFDGLKEGNDKAIAHLNSELQKIRAGAATPSMLDSVKVEAYGSLTPLSGVANVSTLDPRTLSVQPWDKSTLDDISKGIMNANIGLNPQNNGEMIIINVPALTEERRRDLGKKAKSEGEVAKVSLRNNRKDAIDEIKKLKEDGLSEDRQKDLEGEVQNMTVTYTKTIEELASKKEIDIMKI